MDSPFIVPLKYEQMDIIDELTYRSWRAQVDLYKMPYETARKFYKHSMQYEKRYEAEKLHKNIKQNT